MKVNDCKCLCRKHHRWLVVVYMYVQSIIIHSGVCSPKKLSIFSEFLMTLMHLRLNLSPAVLANYYLKNSTDTAKQLVLNILRTWISFLYTVLTEDDDLWLNPEYAMRLSSSTFENQFGINTVAVGDCSNMNCSATPGNSFSNNVTYSMYYQSNCGKYLLAISRVGGILFISDLMCGRTSDLDLHEYCNFFDPKFWKLNDAEMPMPVYMYDKGLGRTAKKEGLRVGFELKTSGIVSNDASKSKSFIRRQEAYEISKMRIRVECVIGFLKKKFPVLDKKWSYANIGMMNKTLHVCVRLLNITSSQLIN